MKKYILLGLFMFVALVGTMILNDTVIFPELSYEEFVKSMTFFRVLKVCGIETAIGTGLTWTIGMVYFSEDDN